MGRHRGMSAFFLSLGVGIKRFVMLPKPVQYPDFSLKIVACLFVSYLVDAINREETFLQHITSTYFLTDLLSGFVIALLLWEWVRQAVRFLDKRYSWVNQVVERGVYQFVLGLVLPSFFCFLLTAVMMYALYRQNIFETNWPYNEFYTVIIIVLVINLTYCCWWFFLQAKHNGFVQEGLVSDQLSDETNAQVVPQVSASQITIEVSRGGKTFFLSPPDIAYAYLLDGYCYIRPKEGDAFVSTYTLDELANRLPPSDFFRINRQMLIHRQACVAYQSTDYGKIELGLSPIAPYLALVSQRRAKAFRQWLRNPVRELA